MKSDILENVILWDWVTISCKDEDPAVWKRLLGMLDCPWEELDHGANGYRQAYYFGSISIWFDGQPGMGCCVNMSGQGCRTFEEYGHGDYYALFQLAVDYPDSFHITRVDVAFDDHTGLLDINRVAEDTDEREFVSRFRTERIEKEYKDGRPGITVYHGSKKSDVMIRIYDKCAERGLPVTQHWIRIEMQLRDDRALQFVSQKEEIGILFRGVLLNYVRYVDDPGNDTNCSRWPLKDYWQNLVDDVERIRIFVKPGVEYNVSNLDHFVFDQAGAALHCALKLYGPSYVFQKALSKDISDNKKYMRILNGFNSSAGWCKGNTLASSVSAGGSSPSPAPNEEGSGI